MRQSLITFVSALTLVLAPAAFATVNHGDFIGTGVDFLQVSETTTTAAGARSASRLTVAWSLRLSPCLPSRV